MVARRVLLKSGQLQSAVDALLAGRGRSRSPVASMRVKQAAPMQALLTQPILSPKLGLIPAIVDEGEISSSCLFNSFVTCNTGNCRSRHS